MRKRTLIIGSIVLFALIVLAGAIIVFQIAFTQELQTPITLQITGDKPAARLTPETEKELRGYIESQGKPPEDYVIDKFTQHDLVILGEYHRIKQDVELVQNLIPLLYENGVHNLAMEFGCSANQDRVDRLVTAAAYDPNLARQIMAEFTTSWPYVEYMDIYKKAWELNAFLPQDAKFRIIHLNNCDLDALDEYESHMAGIIQNEVIDRGEKALVYTGAHHSFTRYHQLDSDKQEIERMGNILYEQMPGRIYHIILHYPWDQYSLDYEDIISIYPVGGAIDTIMMELDNPRVGFDVLDSPFGKLTDEASRYAVGYSPFALADFCDGYIFQKPIMESELVTIDAEFYSLKQARKWVLDEILHAQDFKKLMMWTALEPVISKPDTMTAMMRRDLQKQYQHSFLDIKQP